MIAITSWRPIKIAHFKPVLRLVWWGGGGGRRLPGRYVWLVLMPMAWCVMMDSQLMKIIIITSHDTTDINPLFKGGSGPDDPCGTVPPSPEH